MHEQLGARVNMKLELAIVVDASALLSGNGALAVGASISPVFGRNFLSKLIRYYSICIDVIFRPKFFKATASAQNAGATLPCSRHAPITGASKFIFARARLCTAMSRLQCQKIR